MTEKEFKMRRIKAMGIIVVILYYLWVLNIKVKKSRLGGYAYTIRELNPYNPLSYVLLPIFLLFGIVLYGVIDTFKNVEKSFKYR